MTLNDKLADDNICQNNAELLRECIVCYCVVAVAVIRRIAKFNRKFVRGRYCENASNYNKELGQSNRIMTGDY